MPFNTVTELSQYVSSLVLAKVKDPKVTTSSDYQLFTVGTQMTLDRLQHRLKELIDQVQTAYSSITQSGRVLQEGIHVVDGVSKNSWGYSFWEEHPFCDKLWAMFYHLAGLYQLESIDSAGSLSWNIPKVKPVL